MTETTKNILAIVLALSVSGTFADEQAVELTELKLTTGKVLKSVKIEPAGEQGVTIFHSSGVGTFPWAALPTEIQKRLGYDAEQAMARRQLAAEVAAKQRLLEAASEDAIRQSSRSVSATKQLQAGREWQFLYSVSPLKSVGELKLTIFDENPSFRRLRYAYFSETEAKTIAKFLRKFVEWEATSRREGITSGSREIGEIGRSRFEFSAPATLHWFNKSRDTDEPIELDLIDVQTILKLIDQSDAILAAFEESARKEAESKRLIDSKLQ